MNKFQGCLKEHVSKLLYQLMFHFKEGCFRYNYNKLVHYSGHLSNILHTTINNYITCSHRNDLSISQQWTPLNTYLVHRQNTGIFHKYLLPAHFIHLYHPDLLASKSFRLSITKLIHYELVNIFVSISKSQKGEIVISFESLPTDKVNPFPITQYWWTLPPRGSINFSQTLIGYR